MTRAYKPGGRKILLIDIDGTLVDYENHLPGSAVAAIHAAQKNGHRVYSCTGRSEGEIYQDIRDIGLDGMIGGNGAYVRDGETVILHKQLSAEMTRKIVDWCHTHDLEFFLETNNGLFGSEHFEERALPAIREYSRRKGKSDDITVRTVFPEMIFGADLYRDDVNKISFLLNSYADHERCVQDFPDLEAGVWGGAGETALFGDLRVKGITKQSAVECLLDHLHAQKEDAVAFGDAAVDIPMFEACGYAVAMASGGEECRAAADYITDGVNEDGLYKAFQYLKLL